MIKEELKTKDDFEVRISFFNRFAYAAVVFVAAVPNMNLALLPTQSITDFEISGKAIFEKMKRCVPMMTKDEMMTEFC